MNHWLFSVKNLLQELPIAMTDLFSHPSSEIPSLPDSSRTQNQSRYYIQKGIPVLELTGSHHQMGLDQGELMGDILSPFVSHYMNNCLGNHPSSCSHTNLENLATGCREFMPDRFLEEMRGIVKTTPLSMKRTLSSTAFLDFYSSVMCSCICLLPNRTRTGKIAVGRNLDFPALGVAHRLNLLVLYNPEDAYSFISFTWPGMIGVLTGVNEHGLYLAVAEVDGVSEFGRGLPYPLMHRRVLEECKNVDEAEQLIRNTSRTRSNNLMVVDATNAAVLEYDRNRVIRRTPENGALFNTNHFVSSKINSRKFSFKYLSSIVRFRKITRFLNDTGRVSFSNLHGLLSDLALGRLNLMSVLYEPGTKKIIVRSGAPPATNRKPVSLNLNSLFQAEKSELFSTRSHI